MHVTAGSQPHMNVLRLEKSLEPQRVLAVSVRQQRMRACEEIKNVKLFRRRGEEGK